MARTRGGPGIVKAGTLPLRLRRGFELVASSDYRVRELFEAADVISEGALREERSGLVYYGTTSVLLLSASHGGLIPDPQCAALTDQLRADPHARVRAVRIACREAQVRSRAPIGLMHAEIAVHRDATGIRFDVDVEAQVHAQDIRAGAGAANKRTP